MLIQTIFFHCYICQENGMKSNFVNSISFVIIYLWPTLYDDDAQMHNLQQLEDFIKKKIFDAYKQYKITNFFSPNV